MKIFQPIVVQWQIVVTISNENSSLINFLAKLCQQNNRDFELA